MLIPQILAKTDHHNLETTNAFENASLEAAEHRHIRWLQRIDCRRIAAVALEETRPGVAKRAVVENFPVRTLLVAIDGREMRHLQPAESTDQLQEKGRRTMLGMAEHRIGARAIGDQPATAGGDFGSDQSLAVKSRWAP